MTKRFSKQSMLVMLDEACARYEKEYRFDPTNGYAQVIPRDATERERALIIRAYHYGRYDEALDLSQSLE